MQQVNYHKMLSSHGCFRMQLKGLKIIMIRGDYNYEYKLFRLYQTAI